MSKIIDQLERDEKCVLYVYDDITGSEICKGSSVLGYPTIGIGRMIDRRKGGGITRDEAKYLLGNDVKRVRAGLERSIPWVKDLDEAREGVLVNMAFQMGIDGLLAFKKALNHVHAGQYVAAASEMLQSKWAKQTPERAERLAKQMATGQWQ